MQHLPKQSAENAADFRVWKMTDQDGILDFWGTETNKTEMSNRDFGEFAVGGTVGGTGWYAQKRLTAIAN